MRLMRIQVYALLGLSPLFAATLGAQQDNALSRVFDEIRSGRIEVVDLTHPLDDQSPYWPEGQAVSPFHASVVATFERDGYFARLIIMPEHFGTHMDAPAHFDPKGMTVDRIPVEEFLSEAMVVNVSGRSYTQPDYRVTVEDLEEWAKANGAMPRGCVVLLRTGWGAHWPSNRLGSALAFAEGVYEHGRGGCAAFPRFVARSCEVAARARPSRGDRD